MAKQTTRPKTGVAKRGAQQQRGMLIGGIAVVALAFIVVLLLLINQQNNHAGVAVAGNYASIPQATTPEGAPVLGDSKAKVTLVEFADFSCPHCLEYHPVISQIIDKYVRTGQARLIIQPQTFVGRNFSDNAAQAALCAGKQGRFWDMYDALFNLQETRGYQAFNLDTLKATADNLKVDSAAMLACMEKQETVPALQNAYTMGQKLQIQGVPAVFISKDGTNFTYITDPNGRPVSIPSIDLVGTAVSHASSTAAQ